MREILFRAKVLNKPHFYRSGKWVEGYYVPYTYRAGEMEHLIIKPFHGINDVYMQRCLIDPETVSQWTGMVDKYGDKIFEGDIVEDKYGRYTVTFCKGTFDSGIYEYHGWVAQAWNGDVDHLPLLDKEYLIVGNIWDTPELLKRGKEDA